MCLSLVWSLQETQEWLSVRDIDLHMVADERETFMATSMRCIVHETRILRKARVSPLDKGLSLFIYFQQYTYKKNIYSHYYIIWPTLPTTFCPGMQLYAEVRTPEGKRRFNYILNTCRMVSVAEGNMAQPLTLFGCQCAPCYLCWHSTLYLHSFCEGVSWGHQSSVTGRDSNRNQGCHRISRLCTASGMFVHLCASQFVYVRESFML